MAGASDLQQGHPIALKLDQVGGTAGLAGTLPLGETDRATAAGVSRVTYALGMFAGPASTRVLGDAFGLTAIFVVAGLAAGAGAVLVVMAITRKG